MKLPRGVKDISGQRFGKVIAIEPTGGSKHGSAIWRCICDCGNEIVAMSRALYVGDVKSCGCARKTLDLTGKVFGKLVAVHRDESKKRVFWVCQCECGKTSSVRYDHLIKGNTTSCGCGRITHGSSGSRLYRIWHNMRQRCQNPRFVDYPRYGARGISVCAEWERFESFRSWALENGYDNKLTLDRINVNGNYAPSNCRWANAKQQGRNTRVNHVIAGKTIAEWAELYGKPYSTIRNRLERRHWDINRLLSDYPINSGQQE